jgi:hypothetical protein
VVVSGELPAPKPSKYLGSEVIQTAGADNKAVIMALAIDASPGVIAWV